MLEWLKKYLETFLGKTVSGLIAVFVLGASAMHTLPKWLVTTDIFRKSVQDIYVEMNKGDKWQELAIIDLKKNIWEKRKKDLEERYEIQEKSKMPLTTKQLNLLEDIRQELDYLKEYEATLRNELKKPDNLLTYQTASTASQ